MSRVTAAMERLEERVLLVIPVASASSESVHFNTLLTSSVSASDGDADSLTASVALDPVNGSVMLNTDGSFNYYPNAGFVGTDSFDFLVNDGSDDSNVATVTISVTNTSPTASASSGSTEFNTPLMGFAFGSDADADSLTASVTSDPLHGSVMLSSDGSFLYTPNLDYAGSDAFSFRFYDGAADSNVATFNITVQAGPPGTDESSGGEDSETLNPVELALRTQLTALTQARETTVTGLLATLDGVVTPANALYDSALLAAQEQLAIDLGSYAGNATMYELDDFAWPDAPESEALDFPQDSEQPELPGERPTYSGEEYDFSTDSVYQSDLAEIGTDYTDAVSVAEALYLSATTAATLSFNQTLASAGQQRYADVLTANQNAAAYANTPHPTIDLVLAGQSAHDLRQAAHSLYESMMQENIYWYIPMDPDGNILVDFQLVSILGDGLPAAESVGAAAGGAVIAAPPPAPPGLNESDYLLWLHRQEQSAIWLARAPAQVTAYRNHWYTVANMDRVLARANADALRLRDTTLHAIDEQLQTLTWQVEAWTEAHQIGAATQLALDLALAQRDEAIAIANATDTRDDLWADAVRDRQIALNAAENTRLIARTALTNSTLQDWDLSEQTNWSQYQSDLASNALAYVDNFVIATGFASADLALAPVQVDEQYNERDEQAQHARDRALAIATAEWARATAEINADGGLRLTEHAEKWNATFLAETEYWNMLDAHTDADWQYSYDVADAVWQQTRDTCDRGNDRLISLANAESDLFLSGVTAPLPADIVQYDLDITTAHNIHRDDMADVLHAYQSDVIAAEASRAATKVEVNYDYRQDVNELEATARINVALAAELFAQAKALAQDNFAVMDANELRRQQRDDAQSHRDRREQVAFSQKTFLNVESTESAVRRIADATARHAFETSEAGDEASLLAFWDVTENTPWSEYQADLANSTFDFVDQVGLAVIADVTTSATQEDVWQKAVNLLNRDYEIALADAELVRAHESADHTRDLSLTKASETQTRSNAVALETKDHDVGVANATWTLEDDVAAADSLQQSQQNDALWTYKGAVADEDRELTKTNINQTMHDANVLLALTTRLLAEGAALVTRTNTVGNKQVTWTGATNLLDFVWTINVDTAFNTFATNVRNAMVNDYAADEQAADINLANANANAEYARAIGFVPLDTVYGSALTNADALWSSSLDDELSDYREGLVDHWGEYEEGNYSAHFTAQQAEFLSTSDPLDGYQASYAQTESAIATAMRTQRNTYHDDVTLAHETYTDNRNTQSLTAQPFQQLADTAATYARATQTGTLTLGTGTAYAQQSHDNTVADADRFQSDVFSETSYSDLAIGHRNSNRLAQANHNATWANNVAMSASTLHQAQYSASATATFNANQAFETTLRKGNIRTENLLRIGNIGTTQTTRGTSLGNNEIAQVTTYGNAGVTLSGSLTTAEDNHDLAAQTTDATHRSTMLGLWSSDQLNEATQQQLLTSSLGNASVTFLNNLRPSLLTSATNLANAEAAYHLTLATNAANEAAANAITLATPAAQFEADEATIRLTWLQQMAPQFTAFVNASATAEADASRDFALADRDFQNNAATEEFNYLTTVLPLMTGLATASAANSDTLHNNLSDESQTHRLSSSTADLTHGVSGSTANKQHRLDRAGNRQIAETALENADQDSFTGQDTFRTSEADSELSRAAGSTGIAESDKTWRYDLAAADRTESRNNATHQKNSQLAQATLQQTFSNSEAAAAGTYDLALATHEQTYGTTTLTADIARATALGNAQLAWLNATYAADNVALTQLDTLNTDASDWTTHLVQLAGAKQSWWTTFSPNFTTFINNVTNQWTTEQLTANSELSNLATTNQLADLAYANAIATATFQATTFLAAQYEQREFDIADADESFQQSEATARRTFDTTKATLTRDTSATGSPPLAPGATVYQATTDQTSARNAAKLTFDTTTALPVAGFSVTQSATSHWWTTQTNTFASTHATARATALDDFLTNTSEATRLQRSNSATLAATLDQNRATDFAAAIATFSTTNPTPWATFAVSKANAQLTLTTTVAPARAAHDSGMAQADHDFLSGLANSLAQYINDQTTLDNTTALTAADDDLSSSILGANGFLNPPGSASSTDVLTAVNVPGSIAPGAPSGFTFNTNAAPPQFANHFAWANPLRRAPSLFPTQTGALPDDHVEPATPMLTTRATMDRSNSNYVAWLDAQQTRTQPSTTTSNNPNNSADLGEEARRTNIDPKSNLSKQVSPAVDRAADVVTQKVRKLIWDEIEYHKGLAKGFAVDGLVGDGQMVWSLAKLWWRHSPINPDFASNVYEDYQFAKDVASKIDIPKWAEVLVSAASNGWQIVVAAQLHQIDDLTPQQKVLLEKAGEILLLVEQLLTDMVQKGIEKGLDPQFKGRIVGMIAYEFVTDALISVLTVGTAGAAAPVAAAKVAALIKKLDRLAGRYAEPLIKALKGGGELCKKIEGFVDALKALSMACFVAGTPLLTPDGEKPIEQFQVGDPILARPENDPNAPVRTQYVDALFKLEATVIDLRIGGQLVETTAEHPFFVAGQGWVRARDLQPGDPLLGHDERVTLVRSLSQTDRVRTVYNIRVTEDQTYFVGRKSWGFSIWVHNAYSFRKVGNTFDVLDDAGNTVRKSVTLEARKTGPGKWDIVDPSDGFVVKKDAGIGEVRGLGNDVTLPTQGRPPVINQVRPYDKAKLDKMPGYDDHHLDPPLGRHDPSYSTGPTIPIRNDNAGGVIPGGKNFHTAQGGFQPALRRHITKELGFTIEQWNRLPESVRKLHLRRYYASLGIDFPF